MVSLALLARLRGSLVGAWLACAYALAVLAASLASAAPMPGMLDGAVLCSGLAVPGERPALPAEPCCKGCPVNPVLGVPPTAQGAALAQRVERKVSTWVAVAGDVPSAHRGFAQSRAPPAA